MPGDIAFPDDAEGVSDVPYKAPMTAVAALAITSLTGAPPMPLPQRKFIKIRGELRVMLAVDPLQLDLGTVPVALYVVSV